MKFLNAMKFGMLVIGLGKTTGRLMSLLRRKNVFFLGGTPYFTRHESVETARQRTDPSTMLSAYRHRIGQDAPTCPEYEDV